MNNIQKQTHTHYSPIPKADKPLKRNSQIMKGYAKLLKSSVVGK